MSDVSQNIGEYNSDSGLSFDIEIPDIPIPEPEEEVKSEVEDKVDVAFKFAYRAELTDYINSTINKINEWLKLNSSKPLASVATTYRDYISNINVDSLITDPSSDATFSDGAFSDGTPLNSSLEKYVEDQGVTAININQLL